MEFKDQRRIKRVRTYRHRIREPVTISGIPRPPCADEAGGLYNALNRGNGREEIFHTPEDYAAFERLLAEGLDTYVVTLFVIN